MYCTRCGIQIEDQARFCSQCGQPTVNAYPSFVRTGTARPLMRVMQDRKIAGVCAGLAVYFQMDVNLVRVLWALSLLIPPPTLIAYLICWLVLPPDYITPPVAVRTAAEART